MNVGKQVMDSMKKIAENRFEDALVAASAAVAATARLEYPTGDDKVACRQFLEHNLQMICTIGWVAEGAPQPANFRYRRLDLQAPGISLRTMAEMLYDVVRCTAVHEAGLRKNLRFTKLPVMQTVFDGELVLPVDVIYGLLLAIVGSPQNAGQQAEGDPLFSFGGRSIRVNELWGDREKIAAFITAASHSVSSTVL